jgi:hypothetical protein
MNETEYIQTRKDAGKRRALQKLLDQHGSLRHWQVKNTVRRGHVTASVFPKSEVTGGFTRDNDGCPRLIVYAGPEHILSLGPIIAAIETDAAHKSAFLLKGLKPNEKIERFRTKAAHAYALAKEWESLGYVSDGIRPVEFDGSAWDGSLVRALLESVEGPALRTLHDSVLLNDILKVLHASVTGKAAGLGITVTFEGRRRSGDPHTSFGNALVNLVLQVLAWTATASVWGLPEIKPDTIARLLAIEGDDCIAFLPEILTRYDHTWRSHMSIYGIVPKGGRRELHPIVGRPSATFCSAFTYVNDNNELDIMPDLARVLTKCLFTVKAPGKDFASIAGGTVRGRLALAAHVPIAGILLRCMLALWEDAPVRERHITERDLLKHGARSKAELVARLTEEGWAATLRRPHRREYEAVAAQYNIGIVEQRRVEREVFAYFEGGCKDPLGLDGLHSVVSRIM